MTSDQVEQDKQRWHEAHKLLKGKTKAEIRNWLDRQDEEFKVDMARRLNEVVKNRKVRKWQND